MSKRYYVYRLIDREDEHHILQGLVELPEQTDGQSMNDHDARSMVADAAIRSMIRSNARPVYSHIQYCELTGEEDVRLLREGGDFTFDWANCELGELELKLSDED